MLNINISKERQTDRICFDGVYVHIHVPVWESFCACVCIWERERERKKERQCARLWSVNCMAISRQILHCRLLRGDSRSQNSQPRTSADTEQQKRGGPDRTDSPMNPSQLNRASLCSWTKWYGSLLSNKLFVCVEYVGVLRNRRPTFLHLRWTKAQCTLDASTLFVSNSFDVACVQCKHSHSQQQVPFACLCVCASSVAFKGAEESHNKISLPWCCPFQMSNLCNPKLLRNESSLGYDFDETVGLRELDHVPHLSREKNEWAMPLPNEIDGFASVSFFAINLASA